MQVSSTIRSDGMERRALKMSVKGVLCLKDLQTILRVVVLAPEEARLLNHNYIGTEHILLGLIHEGEGVAAKALESRGAFLKLFKSKLKKLSDKVDHPRGTSHSPPEPRRCLGTSLKKLFG